MTAFSHSRMAIIVLKNGQLIGCAAVDTEGYRPDTIDVFDLDCAESVLEFLAARKFKKRIEELSERGDVVLAERLWRGKREALNENEWKFPWNEKYVLRQLQVIAVHKTVEILEAAE
nr:hypothetical protein [uncultured Roseibium sp.]